MSENADELLFPFPASAPIGMDKKISKNDGQTSSLVQVAPTSTLSATFSYLSPLSRSFCSDITLTLCIWRDGREVCGLEIRVNARSIPAGFQK